MYRQNDFIIYQPGDVAKSPSGQYIPIPAGSVGIADSRGLLCICKNDAELIRLSIFSREIQQEN